MGCRYCDLIRKYSFRKLVFLTAIKSVLLLNITVNQNKTAHYCDVLLFPLFIAVSRKKRYDKLSCLYLVYCNHDMKSIYFIFLILVNLMVQVSLLEIFSYAIWIRLCVCVCVCMCMFMHTYAYVCMHACVCM